MRLETQAAGALAPPGRVPPVATGTATPPPAPGSQPSSWQRRASRIGYWVVNLLPFPVFFIGALVALTSRREDVAMAGFMGFGVGLFLIGMMFGLGRYKGSHSTERQFLDQVAKKKQDR